MHKRFTTQAMLLALLTAAASQPACDEAPPTSEPGGVHYSQCQSQPQSTPRALDLLFVVDDSTAMAGFEDHLATNLSALSSKLENMLGGLPDLHLGVVSTVLETAPHTVPGCPQVGHGGRMHVGPGTGPVGATYIMDQKPSGCIYPKDEIGHCSAHTCEEVNCGHATGTWLVLDENTGCPRCRNYPGRLEDAVSNTGPVGVMDCPFSQPLEAMKQSLESDDNAGFRREDAFLGIIFFTATDDCSVAEVELFAPENGELGPLTSFRCFEHGVTCDQDGREPGPRQSCQPREDAGSLLTRVSEYVEFLRDFVDPQLLVIAGVVGPFENDDTLTVELDPAGDPRLAPSCTVDVSPAEATPAVRLRDLLSAFNVEEELAHWAMTSVCSPDYTPSLATSSNHVTGSFVPPCFDLPLRGCADPGAEEGQPKDDATCNDTCQPTCVVTDVQQRSMPDESQTRLPPCLEVCADGPCPGNTDPALAFASGRPLERDFWLPVPACWYVTAQDCPATGQVVVARQADPPPRTFVNVCCSVIPERETRCDDGEDGDGDCLVDLEDPDCAEPAP